MKKILVIGSEGNVGKRLVPYLRSVGHEVFRADIKQGTGDDYVVCDINNPLDLMDAFNRIQPGVIYLLAASVSRVTCEQSPALTVQTNLSGLQNIISICTEMDAELIFFSTSEIYGDENSMIEQTELITPKPNNFYGLTKLLGEKLCLYHAENGLRVKIVRPFMMYDENETRGAHRSAMIRFAENLANGKSITVHAGTKRSWLHMDDAVVYFEHLLHVNEAPLIVNVGTEELTDTEDLAKLICRELNADPELIQVEEMPDKMTAIKRPGLQRLKSLTPHEPQISIFEGVERVCRSVVKQILSECLPE